MKLKSSSLLLFIIGFSLTMISCKSPKNGNYKDNISEFKMNWNGYERLYLVHLPSEEKMQNPVPVLFNIHGGGGTAKGNIKLTFGRFNELSKRDGFIVVYPEAVDKNWNDGRKSDDVKSWRENIDDVGFITAIVDELKKSYNVDNDRIFTSGMSNGGFMSSRLACDKADIFRGSAILTASLSADYLPLCNPEKPMAIMVMNGTKDKLVPYDGGEVKVFKKTRGKIISTDALIDFWKKQNDCTTKKSTVKLEDTVDDGTTVFVEEYSNCNDRGSLILYKINEGGHTWPGGKQYLGEWLIGKTNRDIVACDVIWNYFKFL